MKRLGINPTEDPMGEQPNLEELIKASQEADEDQMVDEAEAEPETGTRGNRNRKKQKKGHRNDQNYESKIVITYDDEEPIEPVGMGIEKPEPEAGSVELFKERLIGVLENSGFGERRSQKMACDDFLELLALFNKNGIHFK